MNKPTPKTFTQAWAHMEAQGYHYGTDELEHVHLGWNMAQREIANVLLELAQEIAQLKRGEFICRSCGLRKDGEHTPADF